MAAQFPYEINNPTFAIQRTRCSVYVRGKKNIFQDLALVLYSVVAFCTGAFHQCFLVFGVFNIYVVTLRSTSMICGCFWVMISCVSVGI